MELAVLGCAVVHSDTRSRILYAVSDGLFASDEGKLVYAAVRAIDQRGYVVTAESVSVFLQAEQSVTTVDAGLWVASITTTAADPSTVDYLISALTTYRFRTMTAELAATLAADAGTAKVNEVMGKITAFQRAASGLDSNRAMTYDAAIRELAAMGKVKYFVAGLGVLDAAFQIDEGSVCYLGGKSGGGKTAFLLQMSYNVAQMGHKVGIIEIEMRRKPLASRLSGIVSGLNTRRVMHGELNDMEREHLIHRLSVAQSTIDNIRGIEPSSFHADMLKPTIERWRDEWGCELLMLDYAQILDSKGSSDNERVKYSSRAITAAAKDTGVAIVALSQVRKIDGDITQNDFRDSSQIGNDADTMAALNPVDGWVPGNEIRRIYFDLIKNRNGSFAKDILNYHLPTQTFTHSGEVARPAARVEPEQTPF